MIKCIYIYIYIKTKGGPPKMNFKKNCASISIINKEGMLRPSSGATPQFNCGYVFCIRN